jgi:hypothetical protein
MKIAGAIAWAALLLRASAPAAAQEEIAPVGLGTFMQGGLAVRNMQVTDATAASLRWNGIVAGLAVALERNDNASRQRVALNGSFGGLSNRFDLSSAAGDLSISYNYARSVATAGNGAWRFYAGGDIEAKSGVQYYYVLDESHLYWLTSYELGADGIASYRLGRSGELAAHLSIPLIAFISRPPEYRDYNNDIPEAGRILTLINGESRLATPSNFRGVDAQVAYTFDLTDNLRERVEYTLWYRYSSKPLLGEYLTHSLQLSLLFSL